MASGVSTLYVFLSGVTLLLVTAHALGLAADRLGFAPVVGELLTGLVLGPSVLGLLFPSITSIIVPIPEGISSLASIGLILLLVLAGTEIDVSVIRRYVQPTIALAAGASIVPFLLGFALGWFLPDTYLVAAEQRLSLALFLATALSISAVPVATRVLIDLDAMNRTVGQLTVTAAVIIDAAGWIALTFVSDIARAGHFDTVQLSRTVVVLVALVVAAAVLGPRIVNRLFVVTTHARSPVLTGFSMVLVVGFALSWASLILGLEPVLGAFLAGLLVKDRLDADTSGVFQIVTLGFFAPLFFATAGLQATLSEVFVLETLFLAGLTLVVAVFGKFLGVALGAMVTDLTRAETLCIAIGLNARGAMEIVVAAVGLAIGVLTPTLYTVIVLVAIVTSIMTPPLLRRALSRLSDDSRPMMT